MSGSAQSSKSTNKGSDDIRYNEDFLNRLTDTLGPAFTRDQIVNMLPQSQGLFGNVVGYRPPQYQNLSGPADPLGMARPQQQPQQQAWYPQASPYSSMAASMAPGASSPGAQAGAALPPPAGPAGPTGQPAPSNRPVGPGGSPYTTPQPGEPVRFTVGDLNDIINSEVPNIGKGDRKAIELFMKRLGTEFATGTFTIPELEAVIKSRDIRADEKYIPQIIGALVSRQEIQNKAADPNTIPTIAGGQNPMAQANVQALGNLGFGTPDQGANVQASVAQIPNAPEILANEAAAAQANIAAGDFDKYQQAIYQTMYSPIERDVNRQQSLDERALQAQLANAGMASSGSGIGQVANLRRQGAERLMAASQQASYQAASQRYGQQFAQEMQNAEMRQQTNLQNAQLDLTAQVENAASLLRTGAAKSDTYLRAIGLNSDIASRARNDFLGLLGIQSQDLARQDQFSQNLFAQMMDGYLKQFSLYIQAGQSRDTAGKSQSSGASGGVG